MQTVAKYKPTTQRPAVVFGPTIVFALLSLLSVGPTAWAAEGKWSISAVDESDGAPTLARIELTRPTISRSSGRPASRIKHLRKIKPLLGRTTVETGFGFVIDDVTRLNLSEGAYEFRVSRGPEYRVMTGHCTIEKTSADEHVFALPRILDMRRQGWTSGDCFVPRSRESLPVRMSAEDLHVAATLAGESSADAPSAQEIAGMRAQRQRREQPPLSDPLWIRRDSLAVGGLAFYHATDHEAARSGSDSPGSGADSGDSDLDALGRLAQLAAQRRQNPDSSSATTKVAIEDPFAWPIPIYLASGQVDGYFVLGDWLRLDTSLLQTRTGRPFSVDATRDAKSLGREAEQISWELLDAGFRLAPLAGSGDAGGLHPVGYNRLYVAGDTGDPSMLTTRPVESEDQWWSGAWAGRSFATNGPLLIAHLDGELPGHVFHVASGTPVSLTAQCTLTVQDPVDYLQVIYNGQVHYSAKLDEYAKAGGKIPALQVTRSGWALIRVVTLHDDHFRAATTAPWYFEVDGQRRISRSSIEFFQTWLADYETHLRSQPGADLNAYAPFIRSAREFWESRLDDATTR